MQTRSHNQHSVDATPNIQAGGAPEVIDNEPADMLEKQPAALEEPERFEEPAIVPVEPEVILEAPEPPPPLFHRFRFRLKPAMAAALVCFKMISYAYSEYNIAPIINQGITAVCSSPMTMGICGNQTEVYGHEPRFDDLVQIQTGFEPLLQLTGYGITLGADMKQSQGALEDLGTLVRHSKLKSKQALYSELRTCAKVVKDTSRQLLKWDFTVVGGVNSILNRMDHAITVIKTLDEKEKANPPGNFLFKPSQQSNLAVSQKRLFEEFDAVARELKTYIKKLRELSFSTGANIERANSHLVVIHDLITQEKGFSNKRREEVLADLWSWTSQAMIDQKLFQAGVLDDSTLISQVEKNREAAAARVQRADYLLDSLEADIDRLREQVSTPVPLREITTSLEAHFKTLEKGYKRLSEGGDKAKVKVDDLYNNVTNEFPQLGLSS